MPYIPNFNKISLQEQVYAPTLMRQQHDETVAKQMELSDALKFDYLKQDSNTLEPVLKNYSDEIGKISSDLSKSGFTQDTKSKLLGLRSKFTSDDKIRQIKKNYSDATSQWDEVRKRMIQEGRPGDEINRQKNSFFSAYQGAFSSDDDGLELKNDFNAGATSGHYDIVEDAKKAMTSIGQTGKIVGSTGSSIVEKSKIGANGLPFTYYEVTDNRSGQRVTNLDQRQAVERYLMAEYGDKSTDRGLYAQIAGLTPDHIKNAVSEVSNSMKDDRYSQIPQSDTNISGVGKAASDNNVLEPLPEFNIPELNKDKYDDAQNDENILLGKDKISYESKSEGYNTGYNPGWYYSKKSTQEDKTGVIKKYKDRYPRLFGKDIPDDQAAIIATKYEKAYSAINSSVLALKSKDIVENLQNSILKTGGENNLERVNSDGSKSVKSISDIAATYKDTGVDWKQVPPLVNPYGITFIRDADDNLYKVNEDAFDKTTQKLKTDVIKPVMDQLLDPQLADKNANKSVRIPGTDMMLHVNYDENNPYDVTAREIIMYKIVDGKPVGKVVQPGELFQELTEGIRTGFQTYKK